MTEILALNKYSCFEHFCTVIYVSEKRQTWRDKMCAFSIKHEAPSHHKKYFRRLLFSPFLYLRFYTHFPCSVAFRNEKLLSGKIHNEIVATRAFSSLFIFPFYKRTHFGHHHYQLNGARCLELLECLTLFVSHMNRLLKHFFCVQQNAHRWEIERERERQKKDTNEKHQEFVKGFKIINWICRADSRVLKRRHHFRYGDVWQFIVFKWTIHALRQPRLKIAFEISTLSPVKLLEFSSMCNLFLWYVSLCAFQFILYVSKLV